MGTSITSLQQSKNQQLVLKDLQNTIKTINNEIERQALQHQIDIIVAQNYLEYVNR